mmetsp:Transcript_14068/g.42546  ORF Transcript_14068/g.42546 Transcript_14068/m.42546 type:complete len:275 (+) Transcript_14068:47-871(+)
MTTTLRRECLVALAVCAGLAQCFVAPSPQCRPSVEASALGLRTLGNFIGGRRKRPQQRREDTTTTPPDVKEAAFEEEDEAEDSARLDFFADVDALHAAKRYADVYASLKETTETGPDVQWRLARVCVDLSALSKKEKERYVREGLAAAEGAAAADPGNPYAQKWYGIALGLVGDFESVKTKIQNSLKIKNALDIADAKLPNDATVSLALGQWSSKLAGLGFVERKIAGALFGALPAASHADALAYYEKSHAIKQTPRTARLIQQTKRKLGLLEE